MSSTWRAATALGLAALSLPLTGCIHRVSVNSDAEPANSASSPSIDGAGQVVAFLSSRTGFNSEVWVRYLAEGVTEPVTYDGTVHDGYVQVPRMSASGKHVAFSSSRDISSRSTATASRTCSWPTRRRSRTARPHP